MYPHPDNDNIKLWDLPGVGSPTHGDLEKYSKDFNLENYDTFLILAAIRFTENDRLLADHLKSIKKPFFFIRTKIDFDRQNEKRKLEEEFNEGLMLENIRKDCLKNLEGLIGRDKDVFLISNHYKAKWDFDRLKKAILGVLPVWQRESLILSLGAWTKDALKQKIELLRGRIWMVASASAAGAMVPLPGLSVGVDLALLIKEVNLYKSQLGLPDQDSEEFKKMAPVIQEVISKFCITTATQLATLFTMYAVETAVEEFARFIPVIGSVIAGGLSFTATYFFLNQSLNELGKAALSLIPESADEMNRENLGDLL